MSLQALIETHVALNHQTATGFFPIECPVCNDHSVRAGFKFDDGEVGYNCFNCKAKFSYTEGETLISKNAITILQAFGISHSAILAEVNHNFFETGEITMEKVMANRAAITTNINHLPEAHLPAHSFFVGNGKHPEIEKDIIEYLSLRKIDPHKIKAMYSLSERHIDRILIPIYYKGKLIHWQSRSLKNERPRYLTCHDNKQAAVWGMHNLFKRDGPLFITEGIFDASLIDGISILGSDLTPSKIQLFNSISRDKVLVIDYDKNGKTLAEAAIRNGWKITFACQGKDVNKSVIEDGILFTIHTLFQNICEPKDSGVQYNGMDLEAVLQLNFKIL